MWNWTCQASQYLRGETVTVLFRALRVLGIVCHTKRAMYASQNFSPSPLPKPLNPENLHPKSLETAKARDAKYVADGGFCGAPNADGTRRDRSLCPWASFGLCMAVGLFAGGTSR